MKAFKVLAFASCLLLSAPVSAEEPHNPIAPVDTTAPDGDAPELPQDDVCVGEGCCKVCKKGKACGDSCIAKTSRCNKTGGCACNG